MSIVLMLTNHFSLLTLITLHFSTQTQCECFFKPVYRETPYFVSYFFILRLKIELRHIYIDLDLDRV